MKTRHWLVVVAVAGIVLATAALVLFTVNHRQILRDTGETRSAVETSFARLIPTTIASARDEALARAAEQLGMERYVASVWLVDEGGTIVLHRGGPGREGDNVRDLERGGVQPLLDALPEGSFSPEAQAQLLAVAALRSEGEHNDVFRHLARPLLDESGKQVGVVVLAYDVSPAVAGDSPVTTAVPVLVMLGGLATYWLALPAWVFLDARSRGENAVPWLAFVLVSNLVGLIAYLIVRARPRAVA